MLMQDSQRGGAKNLALHLLKQDNDHVEVHELRGFVSRNLMGALNEIYAASRATRAKKFMYTVSFNPPPIERVSTEEFLDAIERVEEKMGLLGQQRAIVFHEKNGRRHAHVVWSRIDVAQGKAIELPFTKRKLKDLTRDFFVENDWQMPPGYANSEERNPLNYNLAQWQQAKRAKKDAKHLKSVFADCWALSDGRPTFASALKERGFVLAKGNRRGVVAIDETGEVYSVAKWAGTKAKEVRAKLGELEGLPSVEEAKANYAKQMSAHLKVIQLKQSATINQRLVRLKNERAVMVQEHRKARFTFEKRAEQEQAARQRHRVSLLNSGFRGLFDRLTGRRRALIESFKLEDYDAALTRQRQKDTLIFSQLESRQILEHRRALLRTFERRRSAALDSDIAQYFEIRQGMRDKFERESEKQNYGRDGPSLTI